MIFLPAAIRFGQSVNIFASPSFMTMTLTFSKTFSSSSLAELM